MYVLLRVYLTCMAIVIAGCGGGSGEKTGGEERLDLKYSMRPVQIGSTGKYLLGVATEGSGDEAIGLVGTLDRNNQPGQIEEIVYSAAEQGIRVVLAPSGLPEQLIAEDGSKAVFENYLDDKVDVRIIDSMGNEVAYKTRVELAPGFVQEMSKLGRISAGRWYSVDGAPFEVYGFQLTHAQKAQLWRLASFAVQGAGCVAAIVAAAGVTAASLGAGVLVGGVAVAAACGSYFLSAAALATDNEWVDVASEVANAAVCSVGDLSSCLAVSADSLAANEEFRAMSPVGVTAAPGDGYVKLSWVSMPGAVYYTIYQSSVPGAENGTRVAKVSAKQTSYVVAGLQNGKEYYFVIRGMNNNAFESEASREVSAKPGAESRQVIYFHGYVNNVTDPSGTSTISVGDSFVARLEYSLSIPDTDPYDPGHGEYLYSTAQSLHKIGMMLSVNGVPYNLVPDAPSSPSGEYAGCHIWNDWDQSIASGLPDQPIIDSASCGSDMFGLAAVDEEARMLSSDKLPLADEIVRAGVGVVPSLTIYNLGNGVGLDLTITGVFSG